MGEMGVSATGLLVAPRACRTALDQIDSHQESVEILPVAAVERRSVSSPGQPAVSHEVSIRTAAVRPTHEAGGTEWSASKGVDDVEHRPVPPGATRIAREGLSGVPRRRRDGEVASATRIHRQGPPLWTRRSAVPTRCRSRTSRPGKSHSFGGEFLELVPHERIRHTDKFDDPNLPGEMQVTVTLKKVSVGTELNIVQEGMPEVIPARLAIWAGRNRCAAGQARRGRDQGLTGTWRSN